MGSGSRVSSQVFISGSWLWCHSLGEEKEDGSVFIGDGELCLEYGELEVPARQTGREVQSLVTHLGMKPRS